MNYNVLNYIVNNGSIEKPVSSKELKAIFGFTKRELEHAIEYLRKKGHPIVSKKSAPSGYFLPKDDSEREFGMRAYNRQIKTEIKNRDLIYSVDLQEYWQNG